MYRFSLTKMLCECRVTHVSWVNWVDDDIHFAFDSHWGQNQSEIGPKTSNMYLSTELSSKNMTVLFSFFSLITPRKCHLHCMIKCYSIFICGFMFNQMQKRILSAIIWNAKNHILKVSWPSPDLTQKRLPSGQMLLHCKMSWRYGVDWYWNHSCNFSGLCVINIGHILGHTKPLCNWMLRRYDADINQ